MQNKSKDIATPYGSFVKLVDCLDRALHTLDEACEHFELAVLPMDTVLEEVDATKREEILKEIKSYVLMSGFLIDHPLISVIQQIRGEAVLDEDDTNLKALKHEIEVGQIYRHYKGKPYLIRQVSKDSNTPLITYITYQSVENLAAIEADSSVEAEVWTLTVSDFIKKVEWEGKKVNRFQYIPTELLQQDNELTQEWDKLMNQIFGQASSQK